jgi:hypothetical protein
MRTSLVVFFTLCAGCSSAPKDTASSSAGAVVGDILSLSQRADGRFDVVCRGQNGAPNYNEIVSDTDILSNNVCPHRPPPGTIVHGADRSFEMPNSGNPEPVESWGSIFEGYMSFTTTFGAYQDWRVATFQDATGTTYRPSDGTGVETNYQRLPLPVTLQGYSGSFSNYLNLTGVTFEVTKTNPPPSMHAPFNETQRVRIGQIGEDLLGVTMQFTAAATFFQNFTNGNACGQITLVDQHSAVESLTPVSALRTLTLVTPVIVFNDPTCVSSPLTNPEDPNEDVTLDFSNIVLQSSQ